LPGSSSETEFFIEPIFMKKTTPFCAFWLVCQSLFAQCPVGDVYLWGQPDLDSFGINYPNCQKIAGSLVVVESFMHPSLPVHNLHSLLGIDSVMGSLTIGSHLYLQNLDGLDSLRFIGGDLAIGTNDSLNTLAALHNLQKIGGEFLFARASMVKNFHGLENLTNAKSVRIELSPIESLQGLNNLRVEEKFVAIESGLKSMEGLDEMDSLKTQFHLGKLPNLKSLHGLENLKHTGTTSIDQLDSLTDLHGLEGLKSCLTFQVSNNKRLERLDGLENLQSLEGVFVVPLQLYQLALYIIDNPKLHDISAFDHPVSLGVGIRITNNPLLSACSVESICTHLGQTPDTSSISGNLTNCNSAAEILSFCAVPTTVFLEKTAFQVFPNPVLDGGPLQILLENGFFGKVKIELLALDGRQLSVFEKEKTAQRQVFEIENLPACGSFFIRLLDGKQSLTQLVLKF
jgi:hypothetical protein